MIARTVKVGLDKNGNGQLDPDSNLITIVKDVDEVNLHQLKVVDNNNGTHTVRSRY